MADKFTLRSHSGSGIGVGNQGRISPGPVTAAKIGGNELNKFFVKKGTLTKNLSRPTACRTQIAVQFNEDVSSYLLHDPITNHHVIIPDNHADVIEDFMED